MGMIRKGVLIRYIFFMAALLCSVRPVCGQAGDPDMQKTVRMSGLHITVGKAMSDIEAQTGYSFAFNMGQLDTGTPVKFAERELTVGEALETMFGDGKFKYVIRNRFIAVSPNADNAERANVVARDKDNELVTTDTISNGDESLRIGVESVRSHHQPEFEEEPYEIERIVTVIPGEAVVRNYPASYSSYLPLMSYPGFRTELPLLAVKVNFLYGLSLLTPNLAVEMGTGTNQTVELNGSYSWRGRKAAASLNHKQFAHWLIRGEYRWWLCERFDGHYFGAHVLFSKYYVSGRSLPMVFDKKYSYDGWAVGAGATYGYNWAFAKRWGLEFNVGVGYAYMKYDKGTCVKCDPQPVSNTKHYLGPTRAGVNLVFLIR